MRLPAILTRRGLAAFRFRSNRADYYEYLADIIEATEGQRTIKQIFQSDAARYGPKNPRGYLSGLWAYRIEEDGDLGRTFSGTLPENDVRLIGMLQRLGGEALVDGFRDLAGIVRLEDRIKAIFRNASFIGIFVSIIALIMLAAIPIATVPQLRENFSEVDPTFYRPLTQNLFGLADWLNSYWLIAVMVAVTVLVTFVWSLKNTHGRVRNLIDEHTAYGIYRDTEAIRVLVSIATIIKPRGSLNIRLRDAIGLLASSASPWLRSHLNQIMENLDNAVTGARVFNTGLLGKQVYWYLEDLVDSLGLGAALHKARLRLETRTLSSVQRRAMVFNWIMVAGSIFFLIGVMAWHYQVIFELKEVLLLTNM